MDEREIGLRLKGQNGIMRKKFNALQNDIEAQKEEIKSLFEQKRELHDTIVTLEKDIQGSCTFFNRCRRRVLFRAQESSQRKG